MTPVRELEPGDALTSYNTGRQCFIVKKYNTGLKIRLSNEKIAMLSYSDVEKVFWWDDPKEPEPEINENELCYNCGNQSDNLELRSDPYGYEINGDTTEHIICDYCYEQSAQEI